MIQSPEKWRPLTGIPDGAESWGSGEYAALADRWHKLRERMRGDAPGERFMDAWLRERARAFSIETGQIEGLYTLRRGVTEKLIAEGFAGAVSAHTYEGIETETLRGLLNDQEAAYDMLFDDVASGRPLSKHMVCSWHQLLTQHQKTVVGLTVFGERVQVPFERKGQWKIKSNNPRRLDGVAHEYCPPEQIDMEMKRFFELHAKISEQNFPVNVEAALAHHRFVRTHPFQDGNGRVSRLIMAWSYVKRGLSPPVIAAETKPAYIDALELADSGDLRAFSDHINVPALGALLDAVNQAERIINGNLNRPTGNGGVESETEISRLMSINAVTDAID